MRSEFIRTKLLFCLIGSIFLLSACQQPEPWRSTDVTGVLPDLEFSLISENGSPVDQSAFLGKPALLFFGFTNCPGVCPATLGHIGVALDELGERGENVQVLLASVDPERDTPEAMNTYTSRFGPWLHGLTGDEAALRAFNQSYKVDFQAQLEDSNGSYDVIHSSAVFAFDETGECRLLIRNAANTEALVSDLNRLLSEAGFH